MSAGAVTPFWGRAGARGSDSPAAHPPPNQSKRRRDNIAPSHDAELTQQVIEGSVATISHNMAHCLFDERAPWTESSLLARADEVIG